MRPLLANVVQAFTITHREKPCRWQLWQEALGFLRASGGRCKD
jgi:hypothetical protein